MARWRVALIGGLAVAALGAGCSPPGDPRPPNIVLVIGDDHGWPDSGFMGSPVVRTPHLDRLAAEGTVFTRTYNSGSICRPSLLTLLTGLYPEQYDSLQRRMKVGHHVISQVRTLPRVLGEAGYSSFQAGKFWVSGHLEAGFSDGMQEEGEHRQSGGPGRFLGRNIPLDRVTRFVDESGDQPFFLWFAPMLPHMPFDAPARLMELYRRLPRQQQLYYANVTRLDELVGELLDHLERRDLRRNTLVVYLSDNGWDTSPGKGVLAGPRGKRSMYELGFRTPLVFSWPGVVPEGVVSDVLVSTVDLFPTLLDFVGVEVPSGRSGRSLRPLISGTGGWPRRQVIGSATGARAMVGPTAARVDGEFASGRSYFASDGRWWYIWYRGVDAEELYDLRVDPRAERDLAAANPGVVRRLRAAVKDWEQRVNRPRRPASGPRAPAAVQSPAS